MEWEYHQQWLLKVGIRRALIRQQLGICSICGHLISDETDPDVEARPSIDHVIPITMGGEDRPGNLLAAHRGCNTAKGSEPPTDCQLIWLLAINSRLGLKPDRW